MSRSHDNPPPSVEKRKVTPRAVDNLEGGKENNYTAGDKISVVTPEGKKEVVFLRLQPETNDLVVQGEDGNEYLLKKSGLLKSGDKLSVLVTGGKEEVELVGLTKDTSEAIVRTSEGKHRLLRQSTPLDALDSSLPTPTVKL